MLLYFYFLIFSFAEEKKGKSASERLFYKKESKLWEKVECKARKGRTHAMTKMINHPPLIITHVKEVINYESLIIIFSRTTMMMKNEG